ncbi:MAG TPA: transcriptional repressor [Lamprocystis sp. (in: g-proteobacteria)]|nr:transcriptional repressor [Lamprocystis sp. (in: g-proteobacteria)]
MSYSTRQREAILDTLRRADRPLTPQEIREGAHQESAQIGLATVYRALKAFMARSDVIKVEIPGSPPCYEPADRGHHHHFLCEKCRQVFDLHGCVQDLEALLPCNFRVQRHEITLYGLCADCRTGARVALS